MAELIGELITARLLLRPYADDELPEFRKLALDPEVTRLVGDGSAWSCTRAIERFQRGLAAQRNDEGLWLQILDRSTSDPIGVVAADSSGHEVEIGVWVTPARWSTGVAREALLVVLPALGQCFPDQSVIAEADLRHLASDRLVRSLGFREEDQRTGRYGNVVRRYRWTGQIPQQSH